MSTPFLLQAYGLATRVLGPSARLLLQIRMRRGKEDAARIAERRGVAACARPAGRLAWLHGASVGETVSLLPLVERFVARGYFVLLTSGTATSARVMAARLPEGALHQFIPLDTPAYMARFFDHWRPDIALLAESELWPNLVLAAHARQIPLVLVNGRMSERSYRRWRNLPSSIRAILERFDLCLAQSPEDGERLRRLGAPHVVVSGNLKFDVRLPAPDARARDDLLQAVRGRPIVVAASTHDGEELVVLAAHALAAARIPELLTIIVPRHPARGDAIATAARKAGHSVLQRSTGALPLADTQIYLADTMGELGLFYDIAPVALVGGSLVRVGGHNPIEPAMQGVAILTGPHVRNFDAIYTSLISAGGAAQIVDARELAAALVMLFSEPAKRAAMMAAAQAVVAELGGAVDRTMAVLDPYFAHIALQPVEEDGG